jgi:hypothetical protein
MGNLGRGSGERIVTAGSAIEVTDLTGKTADRTR